jgi:hypothetical protein
VTLVKRILDSNAQKQGRSPLKENEICRLSEKEGNRTAYQTTDCLLNEEDDEEDQEN